MLEPWAYRGMAAGTKAMLRSVVVKLGLVLVLAVIAVSMSMNFQYG